MDDILDTPKEVDERESGMRLSQVRKIIIDRVKEEIKLEKPKKEIFQDIIKRYGTKHEKFTGLIVAGSLYELQKQQYKTWQLAMLALLVICVLSSAYLIFISYPAGAFLSNQLIGQFFNLLVGAFLINGVLKFKGFILNTIILIAAIRSFNLTLSLIEKVDFWVAVLLSLYVVTAVLAYVMRKKIFPNIARGPKKTVGGDYIF